MCRYNVCVYDAGMMACEMCVYNVSVHDVCVCVLVCPCWSVCMMCVMCVQCVCVYDEDVDVDGSVRRPRVKWSRHDVIRRDGDGMADVALRPSGNSMMLL